MYSIMTGKQAELLHDLRRDYKSLPKDDISLFKKTSFRSVLKNNIAPFCPKNSYGYKKGTISDRFDSSAVPNYDTDLSVIIISRILWTFSSLFNQTSDKSYLVTAERAYCQLMDTFYDVNQGGFHIMADSSGKIIDRRKDLDAQALCIYALSEFYKATHSDTALSIAIDTYRSIESDSFDQEHNGYFEAYTNHFDNVGENSLLTGQRNTPKLMKTHIGILEAYTNLLRIWPDHNLGLKLRNLIDLIVNRIQRNDGHLSMHFDRRWQVLSGHYSYGYDLQASWLLSEACKVLGNRYITESVTPHIVKMVNAGIQGFDLDGGLMSEATEALVIDDNKYWWSQAEAVVALVNAWQMTGQYHYYLLAEKNWTFTHDKLLDKDGLVWFEFVNRAGEKPTACDKSTSSKCLLHNARSILELVRRI